jgi:hypothetical protein
MPPPTTGSRGGSNGGAGGSTHGTRHGAPDGDIDEGEDDDLPDPQSMIEKSQSARHQREHSDTPRDNDSRRQEPEEEDSFHPHAPKFKTIAIQVSIQIESSYIQLEKCPTKWIHRFPLSLRLMQPRE